MLQSLLTPGDDRPTNNSALTNFLVVRLQKPRPSRPTKGIKSLAVFHRLLIKLCPKICPQVS